MCNYYKKHYIQIAKLIREMPQEVDKTYLTDKFIDIFKEDSTRFRPATFIKAINYGEKHIVRTDRY